MDEVIPCGWVDGRCMSSLKDKSDRCKNKPLHHEDFCRIHSETHKYDKKLLKEKSNTDSDVVMAYIDMIIDNFDREIKKNIESLDTNNIYNLLGLNDSWRDIDIMYWIKLDDTMWDIRTISRTFAMQINQSELSNPCPIFPENPFTRKKIGVTELFYLRDRLDVLKTIDKKLEINIALESFLKFPAKFLENLSNDKNQYSVTTKVVEKLSKTLRYKMINYKDSQGRYCGYWVKKETPKSIFEKYYDEYITANILVNNVYILLDTPSYRKVINKISNLDPEEYNI